VIDDINLTQELSNHEINPANYIHALSVPSGVKVYLTTEYIPKLNLMN